MSVAARPPMILGQGISRETIASLARTYGSALQPVWVDDALAHCVYHNPRARDIDRCTCRTHAFDLVNHRGEVIGRLVSSGA